MGIYIMSLRNQKIVGGEVWGNIQLAIGVEMQELSSINSKSDR